MRAFLAWLINHRKHELTVGELELQQCARDPRLLVFQIPSGYSRASRSPLIPTESHTVTMASNADAAFVEDVDVDQELRSRLALRKNKSGATSPGIESDNEDAPLLSPRRSDYGSIHEDNGRSDGEDWTIEEEFRDLPWWKRPSVRHVDSPRQITNG